MTSKICSKCNKRKLVTQFHKQAKGLFGRRPDCRTCRGSKPRRPKQTLKQKLSYYKKWRKRNLESQRRKAAKRYRDLYRNNLEFRLKANLRQRVRKAIKQGKKGGSVIKDLGCSLETFKLHLQKQFAPGMSWSNYGKWHLDHVVPLCKFDLTDRAQFLKACHYSNIQPLWACDNYKKAVLDRQKIKA